MSALTFAKATKQAAKGRIALDGPSGSGKTYTALTVAQVLGHRIAVVDTEHGSASKYADLFDFDTLTLDRYSPQILIEAFTAAGSAGYDVVIVDSLSHFWMGTDGMLEQVDKASRT
jgi:superfamily II DNA or RNA helicase